LNASRSQRSFAMPVSTTARLPFFAWLGVVPYLTLEAFRATLSFISAQPAGSGLTLDYGQPRSVLPLLERLAHDSLASRVEKAGEPFRLFFTPAEIAAELSRFHSLEDLGRAEINARYFSGRTDQLAIRGTAGRLLSAWLYHDMEVAWRVAIPRTYSYFNDSTGSNCAARVAGSVPKTTPTTSPRPRDNRGQS
jgi:hypothetical protein